MMGEKANNFSVLILTLNEEKNLLNCLKALEWCDDIVVLDSHSTDTTKEIAQEFGVRFFQRKFDNYANQRNYGLNKIPYKYRWVLMVDADEVYPPELLKEISQKLENDDDTISIFRVRRKDFFLGKWIKHSCGYPTWTGRLLKIGEAQVERDINEEYVTDKNVGYLENHFNHYPFNKGFSAWFNKHNSYSTMEAELIFKGGLARPVLKDFLSKDPTIRRRSLKGLFYRLPFRPALMFLSLYIIKRGFLDGRAGFTFCLLRSFYEFMIACKIKEQELRSKSMPL